MRSDERDQNQEAFRILVASASEFLEVDEADVWDSGRVESSQSTYFPYEGPPLRSVATYWWKVIVWTASGSRAWSSDRFMFGTGLCNESDWRADWVGMGPAREPCLPHERFDVEAEGFKSRIRTDHRSVLLRREYPLNQAPRSARMFICGLGFYEVYVNGIRAGDAVLAPSRTEYRKRILHDAFDIRPYLREGANVIGIILGDGWFNPHKKYWNWRMQWYGSPRAIMQCHIECLDGTKEIWCTDNTWKTHPGAITASCIYNGETYDARLEQPGWCKPGFDDDSWHDAICMEAPGGKLQYHALEPIQVTERLDPVSVKEPQPGTFVFDMGQNFAGWVRLRVSGKRGSAVRLRFSENVHPDGTLDTRTSRDAGQTDTYILKGEGEETWEPRFTYHGFQHVEVAGYPGVPDSGAVEGCVVRSACRQSGTFGCSSELINQIHRCTVWSQKSNMMGLPTDDCQRAERMGWLGDAHVGFHQAACNFEMQRFYRKWLLDVADAQFPNGDVPIIAPRPIPESASYCWGAARVLIPWYCYQTFGDRRSLRDHYDGMKRYVDFMLSVSDDLILPPDRYADHCSVHPGWEHGKPELASTWYFYYCTLILTRAAEVLCRRKDHRRYQDLARKICSAFNKRFFDQASSTYEDGSQCALLMPLYLHMEPQGSREQVLSRLVRDIVEERDTHLTTGILGTRYLLELLDNTGNTALAWKLATATSHPSWGFMTRGRTTLSENWNAKWGTNNHIMFGMVDAWFYQTVGGIHVDFSRPLPLLIEPWMDAPLAYWHAELTIPQGRVSSRCRRRQGRLEWDVEIPCNITAQLRIHVPEVEQLTLWENNIVIWDGTRGKKTPGMRAIEKRGEGLELIIGSGCYSFVLEASPANQSIASMWNVST